MPHPDTPSFPWALIQDFKTSQLIVVHSDGTAGTAPLEPSGEVSPVESTTYFPTIDLLEVRASGETIEINLQPKQSISEARTVYLDQNHWIGFATWSRTDREVPPKQSEFFELLATSVDNGAVILPISSAHIVETSRRRGPSRLDVAATMLRYSQGWQMRSVLALRRREARQLFGGPPLQKSDVITFQERALFSQHNEQEPIQRAPQEQLIEQMSWMTSLAALLLDSESASRAGRSEAEAWASTFPPLSTELSSNPRCMRARRW